jgi:hypothetical protein
VELEVGTDAELPGPDSQAPVAVSLPGLSAAVVETIEEISTRFAAASSPITAAWLDTRYGPHLGAAALEALLETGWVASSDRGLVPVRDLRGLESADLVAALWLAEDEDGRIRAILGDWCG